MYLPSLGQTPRALSRYGEATSLNRGYAQSPKELGYRGAALALLEAIAAQLSPNPFVQALECKPTGRMAVVVEPSHQKQIEFDNYLL